MSSDIARLAAEHYPDLDGAEVLLKTSAGRTRPQSERRAASEKLFEFDRERELKARVKRGEPLTPDAWEDVPGAAKAEDVSAPAWEFLRPLPVSALYADTRLDEIVWLWGEMIATGAIVVLAAFMKVGKTALVYCLLGRMMREAEAFGRPTRRCAVLVLALEEHVRDVKLHLREAGVGPDDPVFVHIGPLPLGTETLAELRAFIQTHSIELVVVDTLSRLMLFKSESDNSEVTAKMGPLCDLCRDLHVAIFFLHHTPKLAGDVFAYGQEVRGGGASSPWPTRR